MSFDRSIARELHEWTATALGRSLIEQERTRLESMLRNVYGPVAVQFGALDFSDYAESGNAIRRFHALDQHPSSEAGRACPNLLYSLPEAMPFEAKSVNVLILPHVLEFSLDPHQILRECARVLVPEGHLVLICFNPRSLWGVRKGAGALVSRSQKAPWRGRYFGLSRVKDWLSVLGFEVAGGSSFCFVPPLQSAKLRARLAFLENAGARWWPMWAAVFILVVRKREVGMTPIVPRWRRKPVITPGLAEPATRNG